MDILIGELGALLGNAARLGDEVAAQGRVGRVFGQLDAEGVLEIVDLYSGVDDVSLGAELLYELFVDVELILDLADELLEEILHGDDPSRPPELVDDHREVELRALGRMFAEGVGSTCRPGGDDGPKFARRVVEWQSEHLLRNRELVDDAVARTTPEGLSGSEVAAPLWERAPEVARAREAALFWARVQFLTEAIADSLMAAGPPQLEIADA